MTLNTIINNNNNAMANTLMNELERAITRFFYRLNNAGLCTQEHPIACTHIGVQVPLWIWTHYGDTGESKNVAYNNTSQHTASTTSSTPLKERTELKKAVHLIEWFYRNNISPSDIAVLLPLHWKKTFRQELSIYLCKRKYGCSSHTPMEQNNTSNDTNDNIAEEVQLPFIFAHHELHAMRLRCHVMQHHYKVVLYLLGLRPSMQEVQDGQRQEPFIVDALTRAQECFIICADAGLSAPIYVKVWPSWSKFVNKLVDERPTIQSTSNLTHTSTCNNVGNVNCTFPGLVGSFIPLCCAVHPLHLQLENGLAPIIANCPRYCLRRYDCKFNTMKNNYHNNNRLEEEGNKEQYHVCTSLCHPQMTHTACPYACESQLPCGHKCLKLCSEKCNCYEVIDVPLICSHEELIGVCTESGQSTTCTNSINSHHDNKAEEKKKLRTRNVIKEASWGELIPVYRTIYHIFRGVCEDAHEPCNISYPSYCTHCHGSMSVTCHEAAKKEKELELLLLREEREEKTNISHAEEAMLLCSLCKQRAKEIRVELLGQMLVHSERTRRVLQHELRRSAHQQMKGASHGLFTVGTLVRIIDVTECMPPLDPDVFPSTIRFIDLEDERAVESLHNAHGTVMSLHVNVMDRSEIQYLVRVANGSHVLVTDSGLQMIRPITATTASNALINAQKRITGNGCGSNTDNTTNASSLLLLEDKKVSGRLDQAHHEESESKNTITDNSVNDVNDDDDERMRSAERLIGQTCYLFASVPCASMESGVIVDKVVQVQDVDLTTPGNVMVACTLCTVFANHSQVIASATNVDSSNNKSNSYKRMRNDEMEQSNNHVEEIKEGKDSLHNTNTNNNTEREEVELSIASPCEAERRELGTTFDGGVCEEEEQYKIEALPLTFSVAVDKLQSMQNIHFGKQVCVEEPEQQLCDADDLQLIQFMLTTINLEFLPHHYTLSSSQMDNNKSYSLCGIVNAPLNLHNGLCGPLALLSISKDANNCSDVENKEGTDKVPVNLFVVPYFSIRPDVLADAEAELDSKAQELFARRLSEAISLDTAKRKQQNDEKIYKMLQQLPRIEQPHNTKEKEESDVSQSNSVDTHHKNSYKHVVYSIPHPLPTEEEVAAAKNRSQGMPKAILLRWLRVQDKLVAKKQQRQLCEEVKEMLGKLEKDKDASDKYIKELQREWHVFSKTLRELTSIS